MAQHIFDFKGSRSEDWPTPIRQAAAAIGLTIPKTNIRTLGGGSRGFSIDQKGADSWVILPLGVTAVDGEILVKLRNRRDSFATYNNAGGAVIFRGAVAPGSPMADCLYVGVGNTHPSSYRILSAFHRPPGGGQSLISEESSALSSKYDLSTPSNKTALDHYRYVRVRFSGSTLQARTWWDDEVEPTTWSLSGSISQKTTSGQIAIIAMGLEELTDYEWITIGTGTDPAPKPVQNPIRGVVRTPQGALASGYIVRCYRRDEGGLLGETLTASDGTYTLNVDTLEKVYVVAIDQLGNSWKPPILDRISPM